MANDQRRRESGGRFDGDRVGGRSTIPLTSVRPCEPACSRRSAISATRLRSSRAICGAGASELIAIVVADLVEPVLRASRLRGGSGGRRLGLFARRLQQRREAGGGKAHHRPRARAALRGPDPGAGRRRIGIRASRRIEAGASRRCCSGAPIDDASMDTVTIDNFSASYQATNYLIDLGHTRIGAITGLLHSSTGARSHRGHAGGDERQGLSLDPRFMRSGEFREEVAYSAARSLFEQPDRPTALYVANGVMALGRDARNRRHRDDVSRGYLGRLDRQHSGHPGSEAHADADRAPDRRHGERGDPTARGSHSTRRRGRTAQCRIPTLARSWRQLCAVT